MQTVHDQGHDIAAITRSLPITTPWNDLPAKDLRYRVVAHPGHSGGLPGHPIAPLHHQDQPNRVDYMATSQPARSARPGKGHVRTQARTLLVIPRCSRRREVAPGWLRRQRLSDKIIFPSRGLLITVMNQGDSYSRFGLLKFARQ
jgi:hypothetical protein